MGESKLYIRGVNRQTYEPVDPHKNYEFYAYDKGPDHPIKPDSVDISEGHTLAVFKHEAPMMIAVLAKDGEAAAGRGKGKHPLAVSFLKPGTTCYIDVFRSSFSETAETTIVRLNFYECVKGERSKRQFIGGGTVFATSVLMSKCGSKPSRPSGHDLVPITAAIQDGSATFPVTSGGLYELSLNLTDQNAGTNPKFPIPLFVCGSDFIELDICVEACTRKLMILLTDACGRKMSDVRIDVDGHEYKSTEHGTILLDLPPDESKKTSIKITSEEFEVDQPEIPITDAPAQAVVLQLSKRGFGELLVQVTDDVGAPHVNTQVVFQPLAGGQAFSARSDSNGLIRKVVPKGDYLMSTSVAGNDARATVTVL